MYKKYDIAVFIGRFQPFHNGHLQNIREAINIADNALVIIGSSEQPRTVKNPFTAEERVEMITSSCREVGISNSLNIDTVRDYLYEENKWIREVQESVESLIEKVATQQNKKEGDVTVAILGYEKDESSYYLKSFPAWDFVRIPGYTESAGTPVDATKIRELMFEGYTDYIKSAVPNAVFSFIKNFTLKSEHYSVLVSEYEFIKTYKKQWAKSPYPPVFFTVDGVVIQGGHILLVKRRAAPGKGLWALPGGFIDQDETAKQSVIRELKEETKLKVPVPVIEGSIKDQQLFDAPGRSLRGRTITQAFLIELGPSGDGKLPKVKGADDADEAKWFTLYDALNMSDKLFEDHHSIISMMTGRAS